MYTNWKMILVTRRKSKEKEKGSELKKTVEIADLDVNQLL